MAEELPSSHRRARLPHYQGRQSTNTRDSVWSHLPLPQILGHSPFPSHRHSSHLGPENSWLPPHVWQPLGILLGRCQDTLSPTPGVTTECLWTFPNSPWRQSRRNHPIEKPLPNLLWPGMGAPAQALCLVVLPQEHAQKNMAGAQVKGPTFKYGAKSVNWMV